MRSKHALKKANDERLHVLINLVREDTRELRGKIVESFWSRRGGVVTFHVAVRIEMPYTFRLVGFCNTKRFDGSFEEVREASMQMTLRLLQEEADRTAKLAEKARADIETAGARAEKHAQAAQQEASEKAAKVEAFKSTVADIRTRLAGIST